MKQIMTFVVAGVLLLAVSCGGGTNVGVLSQSDSQNDRDNGFNFGNPSKDVNTGDVSESDVTSAGSSAVGPSGSRIQGVSSAADSRSSSKSGQVSSTVKKLISSKRPLKL